MAARPIVENLGPVGHARATEAHKDVLDRALKQVGFISNMYANRANAPEVLDTYLHGYALFRSESKFTPAEPEVVLLAVSQANGCSYCMAAHCMAAHSMIADKVSGVPKRVLQASRSRTRIADPRLPALYRLTADMVRSRGRPSAATRQEFLHAGYEERHLLYIVPAIAVKTLSNFTNHAFATPVDERFAAYKASEQESDPAPRRAGTRRHSMGTCRSCACSTSCADAVAVFRGCSVNLGAPAIDSCTAILD